MRAVVWSDYGSPDVLLLKEIDKPTPKDNELLIKIVATTVETGDCEIRRYYIHNWLYLPLRFYFGLIRPTRVNILGQQLSGVIEAVRKDVREFSVGDSLFAPAVSFAAYAEYICLPETSAMAIKPKNISYEEAAAVSVGGLNALHFLNKANIKRGEKVLIYGSTGSIGAYAVQLAKLFGAEVSAVCGTANIELVKSLGADRVIDYTTDDFSKNIESYDVIFDTIGKSPFSASVKSLKEKGTYLLANPTLSQQLRGLWISFTSNKRVIFELASYKTEDLVFLKELIEVGKIKSVLDDNRFSLEQIAEAHRYVEKGHKSGNVVITL